MRKRYCVLVGDISVDKLVLLILHFWSQREVLYLAVDFALSV